MLVVEDGSIVPGANSYITIQEYRDYFTEVGIDVVTELDPDVEIRIRKAFIVHNSMYRGKLLGVKVTAEQLGLFPRLNLLDEDAYPISSTTIPQNIKYWQIEAARYLITEELQKDFLYDGKVKRIRETLVDGIGEEIEYTDRGAIEKKIFTKLDDFMRIYIRSSFATLRLA